MSFLKELKRRNVLRVGAAYVVGSWLLIQVAETIFPLFGYGDTPARMVVIVLAIAFIPSLIFSWAFEITPEGLKRDADVDRDLSITQTTGKKLDRIILVVLVLALAYFAFDKFVLDPVRDADELATATQEAHQEGRSEALVDSYGDNSIAVLPFVNMSSDPEQEYFSDGISEELLNLLVRIPELRVISRSSAFSYKGKDFKLAQVAEELNVAHILEGSVRKAGNQVRITAQLIEARSDTHLWSETYTRELDDIFAVQDEIAQAIVGALQQKLSGKDRQKLIARSTSNVQAYNKLLLGRHLFNQRTASSLRAALVPLREAVELDPEYDQAWSTIAVTYIAGPEYGAGTIEEYIPLGVEAVKRALVINPDSAQALSIMAYYKANYEYDWEGANEDFERAIAIEPGFASAHQWYGIVLNVQGRLDEALQQLQIARTLDPLSAIIRHVPGYFLMFRYRLDEAEAYYKDANELGTPNRWTIQNLDILNCLRGNWDVARQYARQLAQMEGFDPAADLARIDAMENPALKERALKLLEQRQDIGDQVFGKALQYALLEEYDQALDSLEKAYAEGDGYASNINYIKMFDPLRDDPRFQAMLREMNLLP